MLQLTVPLVKWFDIVLNVDCRLVPSVLTAVMMTTAIKAAINPYSSAVTAERSPVKANSM